MGGGNGNDLIHGGDGADTLTMSGGTLSGNAIVDGDYMFNKSLSNGVTFGHQPFVGIPDNFTTATPTGLYAAYDFGSAHDSRALDQYGVTDGFTTGSPAWTASAPVSATTAPITAKVRVIQREDSGAHADVGGLLARGGARRDGGALRTTARRRPSSR